VGGADGAETAGRGGRFTASSPLPDFPAGDGAKTVWLEVRRGNQGQDRNLTLQGRLRLRWLFRLRGHPAGEHVAQRFEADGFAEVVVHAGFEALFAFTAHGIGGHGDDAHGGAVGAGADAAGRLVAVEFGHLAIHEDKVVGADVERGEDLESVAGDIGLVTDVVEEAEGDLLVDDVIFSQEDADGLLARAGGARRRD